MPHIANGRKPFFTLYEMDFAEDRVVRERGRRRWRKGLLEVYR